MIGALGEKQRRLLESLLDNEPDLLREVATASTVSDGTLLRIHSLIAGELVARGLDDNHAVNEYGHSLEALGIELRAGGRRSCRGRSRMGDGY